MVQQAGKGLIVVFVVYLGGNLGPWRGFDRRRGIVVQVVEVVFIFVFLRLRLWRRWRGQAGMQLTGNIADLILTIDCRGVGVRVTQPYAQL
ncbi:hypothetical protein D3C81_1458280 [compost metagenome]